MTSALPLQPRMAEAATAVASLATSWSEETAAGWLAPAVDRPGMRRQLTALGALHGACKPGEVVDGDGQTRATVRFECAQTPVRVALELDGANGRITSLRFSKPEGVVCPD